MRILLAAADQERDEYLTKLRKIEQMLQSESRRPNARPV